MACDFNEEKYLFGAEQSGLLCGSIALGIVIFEKRGSPDGRTEEHIKTMMQGAELIIKNTFDGEEDRDYARERFAQSIIHWRKQIDS